MDLLWFQQFVVPLLFAFFYGSILGLERELSHKPAGLRTQVLITLGTTLFVLAAKFLSPEPARIIANVLTGLGFLGAGVVMQNRGMVKGLTTAALIWVNGSMGIVIGLGEYLLASLGLLLALITLRVLGKVEKIIQSKCHVREYRVLASEKNPTLIRTIHHALNHCHYQDKPLTFEKADSALVLTFAFCNPPKKHEEFADKLRNMPDVRELIIENSQT